MSLFQACPACKTVYIGHVCPACQGRPAPEDRAARPPLELGTIFHGCELTALLGRGGMGVVYKARQLALDRTVAIKLLPPDKAKVSGFEERFEREARLLASLSHPNIVTLHEFGRDGDLFFFVMEFIDGCTLRHLLGQGPMPPDDAIPIALQVCDALAYAHGARVVHRDIKPENILLDAKRRVKITDFGLAKLEAGDETLALTQSGAAVGTPRYMAPEQATNAKGVDHRADIWSTGVVLYEMLTGELPGRDFRIPSSVVGVTPAMDEAIARALAREPESRYSSVAELKTDLERATSGLPVLPREEPSAPPPKRSKRFWLFTILFLLGGTAIVGYSNLRPSLYPPVLFPHRRASEPGAVPLETRTIAAHYNGVRAVAFRSDGKILATGGGDASMKLWEVATGDSTRLLSGHFAEVQSVAFRPDGRRLATGSSDGTIRLWDPDSGLEVRTLTGHERSLQGILAVRFSPDGSLLASGAGDRTVRLWGGEDGRDVRTLTGHAHNVACVAFSPDGRTLASGSWDTSVRLWDVATGKPIRTLQGHDQSVRSLDWNGSTLASGSGDGVILLWNPDLGSEIRTLRGHKGKVPSLAFRPDGRILASAGTDGTVRLWEVENGKELPALTGHSGEVYAVAFSLDGTVLASGGADGWVKLWRFR